MKINEELIKGCKVEIDKNASLITLTFLSEETEPENNTRISQLALDELEKAIDSDIGVRFNLLADLTPIPGNNYASEESKKLWGGTKIFSKFARVAVVSKSLKIRVSDNPIYIYRKI